MKKTFLFLLMFPLMSLAATYTYDGFVPTTKTKLWSGFSATDIVSAMGYFCSEWVDSPCDETAYNLKTDGTSVTVQFQHLEGACVKCVGVKFFTESDGVYVQAIYSRYVNGAEKLGTDFDTCSYYSNTPGYSEGWDRGYCVKNLRVTVRDRSSISDGLVAWYKFDGSLNDASGNGYDMTGTCGGYVQGQGSGGQALSCAGGTAVCPAKRIEVEASFTISCWLKADEDIAVVSESSSGTRYNGKMVLTPGQCGTYGSWDGAGIGFAYGKNGVSVYEHGANYLPAVLMYSANLGTGWNHVVISVSNDNAPVLYINGEFVRQGVKGARTHRCVMLGKDCSTIGGEFYGNRFTGCTDDFRIYNRALSAAEVKAGYEGQEGMATWAGKSITPSAWVASNNNVLNGLEGTFSGSRYYESGRVSTSDPLSRLTDGMVNASGSTYGNTVGITSGTLTWQLACPVDLNGLRINTHWCDGGRDGINLTSVEIQQSGSSVWTALPNSSLSFGMNDDDTPGDLEVVYANASNSAFADGVTAIRFNLGTQDNAGSGFTEFEAMAVSSSTYTITFDANGGTPTPIAITRKEGEAYGTLPTVTRDGYVFDGWYTLPSGGDRVVSSTTVMGDIVLYAHWRQAAAMLVRMNSFRQRYPWNGLVDVDCEVSIGESSGYKVGLEVMDGVGGTNLAVKTLWVVGGEETNRLVTVRSGAQRLVWNADADLPDGYKCKMGRARLRLAKLVEFDAAGGEFDEQSRAFVLGEPFGALPIPTRSGYQFVGWCAAAYDGARIDAESIADPVISVLTAKWEVR